MKWVSVSWVLCIVDKHNTSMFLHVHTFMSLRTWMARSARRAREQADTSAPKVKTLGCKSCSDVPLSKIRKHSCNLVGRAREHASIAEFICRTVGESMEEYKSRAWSVCPRRPSWTMAFSSWAEVSVGALLAEEEEDSLLTTMEIDEERDRLLVEAVVLGARFEVPILVHGVTKNASDGQNIRHIVTRRCRGGVDMVDWFLLMLSWGFIWQRRADDALAFFAHFSWDKRSSEKIDGQADAGLYFKFRVSLWIFIASPSLQKRQRSISEL